MGVERAVIRWYAQRQLLLEEVATLDEKIAADTVHSLSQEERVRVEEQKAEAKRRLHLLGPCPTPMMG
ncbi:MAG TPA: hypothetical protein DHW02_16670 [Ktedonobacter sp.]|nr:hypothetical protein [Ktedonobacter sp.]